MPGFNEVLWSLDNEIQPRDFERLCVDLLGREGFHHIVPVGGTKDHGRDAECRFWSGSSESHSVIAFQFSLQNTWEKKLRGDAAKIFEHSPNTTAIVFVTSQPVTGAKQDQLAREFRSEKGCDLVIYTREWIRHRLAEFHQDLAQKYFGLNLPPTLGFGLTLLDSSGLDDELFAEACKVASPELLRASIVESTRKEVGVAANWYRLGRIDFHLRNYPAAVEAISRAIRLESDPVALLNMTLFQGAALAEMGVERRSRPLLIQARNIFRDAVERLARYVDHFNIANVLAALGDTGDAEKHYRTCLELKPDYAEAWKNLGTLLLQNDRRESGMDCFEKALLHKPGLVEAHLSKAVALLLYFDRAEDSAASFEKAYKLAPDLDRQWKYARYWFSTALLDCGRAEESLSHIEAELALRPDDRYLLDLKVSALGKLRKGEPSYRERAIGFLEFRAEAIREDFLGLAELLDILDESGVADRAWPSMESSFVCKPFTLRALAEKAQLPLLDFRDGFRHSRLYRTYREGFSVQDHCITVASYGLRPSTAMLPALDYALLAPFGAIVREVSRTMESDAEPDIALLYRSTAETVGRLFAAVGPYWLSPSKTEAHQERVELLSIGIVYVPDIVVAEAARLVAFVAGHFGVNGEALASGRSQNWSAICWDVRESLLEAVLASWGIDST